MNDYTKLLTNLVTVDVDIEEEDKALILLNSLPDDEYETFVLTLINEKQSFNYNDVSNALVNYEVRRNDKQFSFNGTSAEALMVRGRCSNRKGKGEHDRDLKKNQCIFCKEIGHWKVDCPKIKDKKESKTEANLA